MRRALVLIAVGLLGASPAPAAEPPTVADLVRQLETGTPGARVIAAERLAELGPAAADSIPALARTAHTARRLQKADASDAGTKRANEHLYQAIIDALGRIGPKAAPALVELMPAEKDDFFGAAHGHLGSFGPAAAPVVPALAKMLADEDQDFRVRVAGVLEQLGPAAEPAIPQLIELFYNSKNKEDNRWASGPLPPPPRVAAGRALLRIGPKAAPALADKILPALAEELKTGEHPPGHRPAEVLSVLGETGAPLVPAVVAAIHKANPALNREEAGRALLGMGKTGRKAFGEALADAAPKMRQELVGALKWHLWHEHFPRYYHFEAPALDITPFVPALVTALKDPEPDQRLAAAEVLSRRADQVPAGARDAVFALFQDPAVQKLLHEKDGFLIRYPRLGAFGEPGVRALVALLDSDSVAVRKFALDQLPGSRKWAADVLPKLRKLSTDRNTELALSAAYTAAKLSLDPKDAARLVARRFLRSADPEARAGAAYRLRWLGPVGAPHVDAVVPLLDDTDDEIFQAAAEAIHDLAPKGSRAARALADALAARKLVRDDAGRFVPRSKAKAERPPPTAAELIAATTSGDDFARVEAVFALGNRGAAKEAVPALKKLLLDPDPALRFAAGFALARIGGDAPAIQRLLARELDRATTGRAGSWAVGIAFESLPADFPELVPLVIRCLERRPDATRLVVWLGKCGPQARNAVPVLRKVLRGPEEPVHAYFGFERITACEALGAIGPGARDALPELRQLLDTGGVEFALAARDAIHKITGEK